MTDIKVPFKILELKTVCGLSILNREQCRRFSDVAGLRKVRGKCCPQASWSWARTEHRPNGDTRVLCEESSQATAEEPHN